MMCRSHAACAFAVSTDTPREHDHQRAGCDRGQTIDCLGIAEKPGRRADRREHHGITHNLPPCFLCPSNDREHGNASASVVLGANERQRPKMWRSPEEDDEEQQTWLDGDPAGRPPTKLTRGPPTASPRQ